MGQRRRRSVWTCSRKYEIRCVTILTSSIMLRFVCEKEGYVKRLIVEKDGLKGEMNWLRLLCAVGRQARLKGTVLENLGIETKRTIRHQRLPLEPCFRTYFGRRLWAGPYQFTHVAKLIKLGLRRVNAFVCVLQKIPCALPSHSIGERPFVGSWSWLALA